MKRELNIVQAAESFKNGDKVIIHFVGFFSHAGNVRTLAENITVYSGLTYVADDRQPRTVTTFTEALQTAKALMKDYFFNKADKLSTAFFTVTPETVQPETVTDSKTDYYMPFH